jgi:hypothetical protein
MGNFGNIPPIYPPSYPHHTPIISTKPHHAIFMQTGKSAIRYSETYIYDMVDLISRERYVQYLLYIYIYIYIIYLFMVSCCPYGGGGVSAYRNGNTIEGGLRCFWWWVLVGMVGVWWGKGWGLIGGRLQGV